MPPETALAQKGPPAFLLKPVRARYAFDQWPQGVPRDGFPLGSLELNGWQGRKLQSDEGRICRLFVAAGQAKRAPRIYIEAHVATSVAEAHETLLVWLAGNQADHTAPRLQDRQLAIGDIGFLGLAGVQSQHIAWLVFARGNIAVRVANTDVREQPEVDLIAPATAMDQAILARPALAPDQPPPVPAINELSASQPQVVEGERLQLSLRITDPAGGTPHVQWVVGGPGQGYVEKKQDGRWYFYCTKAGATRLILEATASTGTFARKEISVMALPRK